MKICFVVITCLLLHEKQFAQNKKQTDFTIQFINTVGSSPISFDSSYTNSSGETFTIQKLKYYISHIELMNENETEKFDNDYFLIDATDETSQSITLKTKLNHITAIHFMIGVDSIKNTTGIQSGSLDPLNGMFWTWNTGYIMAKLEGASPQANTPAHRFTYDVGGYQQNENSVRFVTLQLNSAAANNNIYIKADVLKWFYHQHVISIAATPVCHQPGALAMRIADNYSGMFSVIEK